MDTIQFEAELHQVCTLRDPWRSLSSDSLHNSAQNPLSNNINDSSSNRLNAHRADIGLQEFLDSAEEEVDVYPSHSSDAFIHLLSSVTDRYVLLKNYNQRYLQGYSTFSAYSGFLRLGYKGHLVYQGVFFN